MKQHNKFCAEKKRRAFGSFDDKKRPSRSTDLDPYYIPTSLFIPTNGDRYCLSYTDIHYLLEYAKENPKHSTVSALDMLDFIYFSSDINTQSGVVEEMGTEDTTEEQEQNVEINDEAEEICLSLGDMSIDPTFGQGMQENAALGSFLSRPIEIYRKIWEVSAATPFLDVINPWANFLGNARVVEKLQTFKLLHGTLHIKFLINGSPFHYGRVVVGVRPTRFDNNTANQDMTTSVPTFNYYSDYGTPGVRSVRASNVLYTSRPHTYLDPQTNSPTHIKWPFFAATNWIDLMDDDTIDRMGRLEIWELNQLRETNGVTADNVTISALAWMEDVTLTGLTHASVVTQAGEVDLSESKSSRKKKKKKGTSQKSSKESGPTMTNTSGSKTDEYHGTGAVSAPATAIAQFAGHLTAVPYIGRFAKATQMAAGTVGDIAKLFGFSKPVVLDGIHMYRPQPFGNMANVIGTDPIIKLTVDPKQELTVDPATVGLPGDDQMSFGYLIKREAWIDTFPWEMSVLPNRKLYSLMVAPYTAPAEDTDSGNLAGVRFHMTPVQFVARPFKYWTGSLKYRFQIVASRFHRGRLAIQYDPHPAAAFTSTSAPPPLNERYTKIVDLSEERDFTIEVKWSQPTAFSREESSDFSTTVATIGPVGANTSTDYGSTNGRIEVYVLNELTSPEDSADIEINVFISGGDDFEVKEPDGFLSSLSFANSALTVGPPVTTQSGALDEENMPSQQTTSIINGSYVGSDPNRASVYFGENIFSARSMLKRYDYHRTLNFDGTTSEFNVSSLVIFNVPVGPGPTYGSSVASALTPIAGPADYNICNLTYLRYYMQAYIGYRGSLRWKFGSMARTFTPGAIQVQRMSESQSVEAASDSILTNSSTDSGTNTAAMLLAAAGLFNEGGLVTSTDVNNVVEYELPFYQTYRYGETNEPVITPGSYKYQVPYKGSSHRIIYKNYYLGSNNIDHADLYCAAGEDFSLFFFIGCPPLVVNDSTTVTPLT